MYKYCGSQNLTILCVLCVFLFCKSIFATVDTAWVRLYDGTNNNDQAVALVLDGSGNIIITGESQASVGNYDFATIKYSPLGSEEWVTRYDNPNSGGDNAFSVAVDSSGNVYVTGSSNINTGNEADFLTVKYNSSGVEQWAARYDGASKSDVAKDIAVDNSGNVYVAGNSSVGSGNDYATVKYNSDGDEQWVARYNGPVNGHDYVNAMAVDDSGYVYVTGQSWGTDADIATVKYNNDGDSVWVARYNGPGNLGDRAFAIAVDDEYNVIVTGSSNATGVSSAGLDYCTIQYTRTGEEHWVARYNGPGDNHDEAFAIALDNLGSIFITGGSRDSSTKHDYATVKYDSNGVEQWAARYNNPGDKEDYAYSITVDVLGDIYITGETGSTDTTRDIVTIKYDQSGNEIWMHSFDEPEYHKARGEDIGVDINGNVYVTGFVMTGDQSTDYVTIKYTQDTTASPSSPYIMEVQKSDSDISLTWNQVITDTLGNPDTVDQYIIYRDTMPNYIVSTADSVGYCYYPETTFVDTNAASDSNDFFYLVKAVNISHQKSKKSNMGYKLNKFFNENPTTTDKNWTSLPWHNVYGTVSDLTDDLSPNGDPLTKVTRLRDDQYYESWLWDDLFMEWHGADYPIDTGRAYSLITAKDTSLFLVGSNKPDGLVWLNENATTTDKNWVSISYNAVYGTVSDITDEYSPNGNPLIKITNRRNSQYFENWLWDDIFLEWYGANFDFEIGRGYEFVTIVDTTWNPTEYSNESSKGFGDHYWKREERVVTHVGTALATDRAPVSISDVGKVQSNRVSTEHSSHIVRCHIRDTDDVVFTAYRPTWPYDVLTEKMIGCGIAQKNDITAIWFDCGNFKTPWQDGEEVILVVEALQDGQTCCNVLSCVLDQTVDIQDLGMIDLAQGRQSRPDKEIPLDYAFSIEPNPFVEDVQLNYAIPQQSHVEIIVYDISGRRIRTLHATVAQPGYYAAHWDGTDEIGRSVSAGVYILRFKTDDFTSTKKVVLLR